MSAKVKLISFISAFVLVLGIMIIGVLSAEQVQVNIGGSVSFNATNVYARVSGNISGAQTGNKSFSTLTYSAEETTGDESDWTGLALEFTETPDPIVITITVENLSTDRELQVSLENDIQASGLNISITKDGQPYTAGQTAMLAKSTGDGTSTTTFVMSLTVANPDEDLTDANFNYILNLTDESAIKEITVQSADSSMGSVTGSGTFVIGDQVTLTATPGQDYLFTEWRANSAEGERVSGNSTYTYTLTTTSPTTYYAVFEQAQAGTLTYTYDEDAKNATVSGCTSGANVVVIPETTIHNDETYTVTGIAAGAEYSGPFYLTRSTLKSITIPSTMTSIGNYAFYSCTALTEINYNATAANDLSSKNYVFSNAGQDGDGITVNIGANVTRLPNCIFNPYSNDSNSPNITTVNFAEGSVCESIGDYAFRYCSSLTSITFGDNSQLTSIGERAFYSCSSLTSITIPESVKSIGFNVFFDCYTLAEVYNYSGLSIANNISNGYVGYYAKVIHDLSPRDTKPATRIKDYNDVRYYDDGENTVVALYSLSRDITTVSLDSRTTEIKQYAFSSCSSLTSVTFGENSQLTTIGSSAFDGCSSLTSITIPDSVTRIGDSAFNSCSSLTSITLGEGVTNIGNAAFCRCRALIEINYNATNVADLTSNNSVFQVAGRDGDGITVNIGANVARLPNYIFYSFNSVEILPNITVVNFAEGSTCESIGDEAFRDCRSLTSINIPDSVTSIGERAFDGCSSLTSINIPDNVTSIGTYAFDGCSSLTSITIPESVTSIGMYAFRDCSSLTSVTFGENSQLTTIGSSAFDGCSSLTSITIPDSVTSIFSSAFYRCSSLNEVTVESDNIYLALTSQSACGRLINYITSTGETVKVLKSVVDSVDPDFTKNTYLNGSNFEMSEEGDYYVYTHI